MSTGGYIRNQKTDQFGLEMTQKVKMDYSCTNFITKLLNHEIGYFSIKKFTKLEKKIS